MMKIKQTTFKPLDNYHLHWLFSGFLVSLPFNLLLITDISNLSLLITVAIMDTIILFSYIITRMVYPAKYVIEDGYLTKYRSRKKVFQIKLTDIEFVYIKRGKWYSCFVFFIKVVLGTISDESHMAGISILFHRCEVIKKEHRETFASSLKGDDYPDMFEQCDIMSVKKCKKLCDIIGITPKFTNE